jgi:hypothetical protein
MRARRDSWRFAKTFSKRFHEIHHFGGWLAGFGMRGLCIRAGKE